MLSNVHKTTFESWQRTPGTIKAAHFFKKKIGQNIKEKKRDKSVRDGHPPGEGFMEQKFPSTGKPSHWWVCGEFWNLREQHNWEGKKKNPQSTVLTTTPSRKVAQTFVSVISECGLNREARVACLR